MAVEKFRRKASFADGATFAGSVGFSGPVLVNTTQVFGAATTFNATATFSASPVFNMPITAPTGSANTQIAGVLRINSGATTATQSTTRLNSGALVFTQPILVGAGVASFNLIGQIVVTTVAQAASGGYFSLGYTATQNGLAAPVDVQWFIVNPA